MGIFRQFPYTNFHELNLDWFLSEFNKLVETWKTYNDDWENWKDNIDATIEEFRELINEEHISIYLKEIVEEMIESGEFDELLASVLAEMVTNEFIEGDYNITRFNNASNQETFVYWRKIPKDYEPYIAYTEIGTKSPIAMSAETGACSAVNGSRWVIETGDFYGYFRADGHTINDNEFEDTSIDTNSRDILCFKNNALTSRGIRTSNDVLDSENFDWAIVGFETIIENSLPKPRATAGGASETTDLHPRSFIAQTLAGDYIIGSTDGRSGRSGGFRLSDIARFLISLNENVTFAYSLDGGGSVCLYEKGYHVNSYINNERRNVKSTICFKKPEGTYSNVLKQAVSNDENIHRGRNNNYEYKEGNIFSYSDLTTKEINFRSLTDLVTQGFIRLQRERFYVGVENDFSSDNTSKLLLNVTNTAFQYYGISRYLPQINYPETEMLEDAFPTSGTTGIWRFRITSSTVAQNLGLSASDYGNGMYLRIRGAANFDLIMIRGNIYYRYDNGTPVKLNN